MINQIKNLRVEIDGLAQLTDSLEKEITCINLASIPLNIKTDSFDFVQYVEQIKNQKQFIHTNESNLHSVIKIDDSVYIKKSVDSLLLAKAWLGKCLQELGETSPYSNDGKRKTIEDVEPVADKSTVVTEINKFPEITNTINGFNWAKKNHIEKVDWLREQVQRLINEVSRWYTHTQAPSRDFSIARTNVYTHLCEARFNLGFELQRTKETNNA